MKDIVEFEGAKSGRTKCVHCDKPIRMGTLRMAVVKPGYSRFIRKSYYHENCARAMLKKLVKELDTLSIKGGKKNGKKK